MICYRKVMLPLLIVRICCIVQWAVAWKTLKVIFHPDLLLPYEEHSLWLELGLFDNLLFNTLMIPRSSDLVERLLKSLVKNTKK